MIESQTQIKFRKKDERSISEFYAREFIYDFYCGTLDESRTLAVEKALLKSQKIRLEFNKMKEVISYLERIKETQVSSELLQNVSQSRGYFETLIDKLRIDSWPKAIKLTLESIFVVVMMVIVLTTVPWERLSTWISKKTQNEIIITQFDRKMEALDSPENASVSQINPELIAAEIDRESGNFQTGQDSPNKSYQKAETVLSKSKVPEQNPSVASKTQVVTSAPTYDSTEDIKVNNTPEALVHSVSPKEVVVPELAKETVKTNPVGGGVLFRGQLFVQNVEATGEKIRQRILELGGRKAGNVELGWHKMETSRYFHFTIPENKKADLDAYLQSYESQFTLVREKHPRVMPDGIVRIILTVDENEQ